MADKVVQLKNKDNDNIFPISAGVPEDYISTQFLKDGAVTADKIDFSTFEYSYKSSWVTSTCTATGPSSGSGRNITAIQNSSMQFTNSKLAKIEILFFARCFSGSDSQNKTAIYACIDNDTNNLYEISSVRGSYKSPVGGAVTVSNVAAGTHTISFYLGAYANSNISLEGYNTFSARCQVIG